MNENINEILKALYSETQELKSSIELAEMLDNKPSGKGLMLEHLIKRFMNVKVKMYQEHHNEPHIHLDIGRQNHVVSISIEEQEILAGSIDRKYEKIVKDWIKKNKGNLLLIWNQIRDGEKFDLSELT